MTVTPPIADDHDDAWWSGQRVDSATRPCCGGIGGHTHACAQGTTPHPAGATRVDRWEFEPDGTNPTAHRYFQGTSRVVDRDNASTVKVLISGLQHANGHTDREIVVTDGRYEVAVLTPAVARELGQALIASADEVEQMNSHDQIAVAQ
jgi:hypothetical protein